MEPMAPDANPDDELRLREYATELADGIEQALPSWVERNVERLLMAYTGTADPDTMAHAARAGEHARDQVGPEVRRLLEQDVDDQRGNPLAVLRSAISYPTEVLRDAGVPPVVRDAFSEERFPDDVYGLCPAAFTDLDPALHDVGLRWGAAKAFVHKARHRRR